MSVMETDGQTEGETDKEGDGGGVIFITTPHGMPIHIINNTRLAKQGKAKIPGHWSWVACTSQQAQPFVSARKRTVSWLFLITFPWSLTQTK